MSSGNYLVGKGLSFSGFDEYIKPYLDSKNVIVNDRIQVIDDEGGSSDKRLLMSLVGEGILENILNDAMGSCYDKVESDVRNNPKSFTFDGNKPSAYSFQISTKEWVVDNNHNKILTDVGIFTVLGTYKDNDTASKLFPLIAQKYLAKELSEQVDDLEEKLTNIGKRLSE